MRKTFVALATATLATLFLSLLTLLLSGASHIYAYAQTGSECPPGAILVNATGTYICAIPVNISSTYIYANIFINETDSTWTAILYCPTTQKSCSGYAEIYKLINSNAYIVNNISFSLSKNETKIVTGPFNTSWSGMLMHIKLKMDKD